jgi:hypothetical protein
LKDIEFLALAICTANNAYDPDSQAFKLRNPGLLRDFNGFKTYSTWAGGFRALCDTLKVEKSGTLRDIFPHYGLGKIEDEFLIYDFLTRATGIEVGLNTKIEELVNG